MKINQTVVCLMCSKQLCYESSLELKVLKVAFIQTCY